MAPFWETGVKTTLSKEVMLHVVELYSYLCVVGW